MVILFSVIILKHSQEYANIYFSFHFIASLFYFRCQNLVVNLYKLPNMNEQELINALKQGHESAYKTIVNNYQLNVYNTCIGILNDEDAAKDISQDVFIELFRSINKFRGDSKLSTWLYRIAINKSLNHIRDNKKHSLTRSIQRFFSSKEKEESIELEDLSSRSPIDIFEQEEHSSALKKAIEKLPANQKTAFVLKNYDDLSYKEITQIMNLSMSSVESLIHRARKNLQKELAEYYNSFR